MIHKHFHVLYSSERCRNVFENLPIVAYHHPDNLRDFFVRAQLQETDNCLIVTIPGPLPALLASF